MPTGELNSLLPFVPTVLRCSSVGEHDNTHKDITSIISCYLLMGYNCGSSDWVM